MNIIGVDVFVHSAATMLFDNEASRVIPVTIAGALHALKAAYQEVSVKRFVLTSSSAAAVGTLYNGITVTEDSWNERAVQRAWADPPYEEARPLLVYEASKTEAEQAVWKFHKENRAQRPDLVVNAGQSLFPHRSTLLQVLIAFSAAQPHFWTTGEPQWPRLSDKQCSDSLFMERGHNTISLRDPKT